MNERSVESREFNRSPWNYPWDMRRWELFEQLGVLDAVKELMGDAQRLFDDLNEYAQIDRHLLTKIKVNAEWLELQVNKAREMDREIF